FPAPLGPSNPYVSPGAMRNDTSSTAVRSPKRRTRWATVRTSAYVGRSLTVLSLGQSCHSLPYLPQQRNPRSPAVGHVLDETSQVAHLHPLRLDAGAVSTGRA